MIKDLCPQWFCVAIVGVPRGYPHISESPKLMAVEKGRPAMLRCLATGDPKPTVMWLKDMVPVDMSDPRLTILDSGE